MNSQPQWKPSPDVKISRDAKCNGTISTLHEIFYGALIASGHQVSLG